MPLGCKYDQMIDFYTLLNAFINTHVATTNETNDLKNKILSHIKLLYDKYLDTYKKNYDSENVEDKEKRGRDYKQFKIIYNRDQGPKSTKKRRDQDKKN